MKIFPKSSSMRDLVNYVLDRTISHFEIYEYFKSIVLSNGKHSTVMVDFNRSSKYFNTELPINVEGDILTPEDMFGGKYGSSYPVVTTFDRFPGNKTVPDILNDKLFRKISLTGDVSSKNILSDDTLSSIMGFSSTNSRNVIKYWPTFSVGEYWPLSNNFTNEAQLNISSNISNYSIVKLDSESSIYNHFDIEYGPELTSPPIVFVLLGKDLLDGDVFNLIINFKNTDSTLSYNQNAPIVVFLDEIYSDVEINTSPDISDIIAGKGSSIEIGGNKYRYLLSENIDSSIISELPVDWNDPGYFVLDDSFAKYGNVFEHYEINVLFNGTSNKITYNNYGLFNNEIMLANSNSDINMISTPILGNTNQSILDNIDVVFGDNSLTLSCSNGASFHFGKSDNRYSYDMGSYSTSALMKSIIVDQGYLPHNVPQQLLNANVVSLTSSYISGVFSTYDIEYSMNSGYVVSTIGIQGIDIRYHIRRHASQVIVDDGLRISTVSGSFSKISINFGVKRVRNSIFKKLLVFSNGTLLYDGIWINCGDISTFDCTLLSGGSISFDNIIMGISGINSITVSNLKIISQLTGSAIDSAFIRLANGNTYDRNNTFSTHNIVSNINEAKKVLRISSLSGYVTQSNCRYQYTVDNSNNNYYNTIVDTISNRLDFTYHKNKSNFNYKIPNNIVFSSISNQSIELDEGERCGNFYEYLAVTDIGCTGVSSIKFKVPSNYFGDYVHSNSGNYSEYTHSPYSNIVISSVTGDNECIAREPMIDIVTDESVARILSKYATLSVDLIDSRVDVAEISGWKITTNYQIPQLK